MFAIYVPKPSEVLTYRTELIQRTGGAEVYTNISFPLEISDNGNTRYWIISDTHCVAMAQLFHKYGDKELAAYKTKGKNEFAEAKEYAAAPLVDADTNQGFDDMDYFDESQVPRDLKSHLKGYSNDELNAADHTMPTISYRWVKFEPQAIYQSTGNPVGMAAKSIGLGAAGAFGIQATGAGSGFAEAAGDLFSQHGHDRFECHVGQRASNRGATESRYDYRICLELNMTNDGQKTGKSSLTGNDLSNIYRAIPVNVNQPPADTRTRLRVKLRRRSEFQTARK